MGTSFILFLFFFSSETCFNFPQRFMGKEWGGVRTLSIQKGLNDPSACPRMSEWRPVFHGPCLFPYAWLNRNEITNVTCHARLMLQQFCGVVPEDFQQSKKKGFIRFAQDSNAKQQSYERQKTTQQRCPPCKHLAKLLPILSWVISPERKRIQAT